MGTAAWLISAGGSTSPAHVATPPGQAVDGSQPEPPPNDFEGTVDPGEPGTLAADGLSSTGAIPRQAVRKSSLLVHLTGRDRVDNVRAWVGARGGRIQYKYDILPYVVNVRGLPDAAVGALSRLPGVSRVELDRTVHAQLNDSLPRIHGLQDQITSAGLAADGTGVRICIVDTGIRADHVMYPGRIDTAAGYDFVNQDADPEDENGHGSHVAGIAAGRTGLTVDFQFGGTGPEPFQGVAPEATLIIMKVLDAYGAGSTSDVLAGIDRCTLATLPGGPADVINLSLGGGQYTGTCDTDSLAAGANAAVDAGAVVVASAGNDGFANALGSPACGSKVIAVGSTYDDPYPNPDFSFLNSFTFCTAYDPFGTCIQECTDINPSANSIPCYSNGSDELDVTAPGSWIWSADGLGADNNDIIGMHGTSQAAPHVSGLAALILHFEPAATPAQVRQLIRDGAVDFGPTGFDTAYGYGRIDVVNSLQLVVGGTCGTDPECDDNIYCNGLEVCVGGYCSAGSNPCPGTFCRESDDQCVDCLVDLHCDDGDPCNGYELCETTGVCTAGSIVDCNGNLVDDGCETDCDGNGIPDDCDLAAGTFEDCNNNAVPDVCDIAGDTSDDCDANGVPDECEPDCNLNDTADACDIASGTSLDCNGTGIPDECETASGASADCNENNTPDECEEDCNQTGIPDDCDIAAGSSLDCDANGIPDECDLASGAADDCNNNGIPDACDIAGSSNDCNANGIPDECEADCNANGIADSCEVDCNETGLPDDCDIAAGTSDDCNVNAIPDECELAGGPATDCNENGILDECEPDCNGTGLPDECDLAAGTSDDCNANGVPDECDLAGDPGNDCNSNGIPDECEQDCNGTGLPDSCDIAAGTSSDCNLNGVPDECDLAGNPANDCNGNGLPDDCDADCDGNGLPDECEPPIVEAVGSRYLRVSTWPPCSATEVALYLTSPDWPCVGRYIRRDSQSTEEPQYLLPRLWGEVRAFGVDVRPSSQYEVVAVFPTGSSEGTVATTWRWCDANHDGIVNFADVQAIILVFQGQYNLATPESADVEPCEPNRVVNFADVQKTIKVFEGSEYAEFCPPDCP